MRKRPLVLLAFLLMLCTTPSIFALSSMVLPIPAQQNMNKDFRLSGAVPEWYDGSWLFRKSVTVTGSAGAGTDYQIRLAVTYDSDMQADFDDLRFTAYDNTTEWDYWIEEYTASTSAVVWVEWRDDLGSTSVGWMYYGNSGCSTTSNGNDTFIWYEDWTDQDIDEFNVRAGHTDGSVSWSAVDANHGYVAKVEGDINEGSYMLETKDQTTAPMAIIFRANIEDTGAGNTARIGPTSAGDFPMAFIHANVLNDYFYCYDDDGNGDLQPMVNTYFDSWHSWQITRDGTDARLYVDTVLIETGDVDPDSNAHNIFHLHCADSEDDLYSDWMAQRKFIDVTEPEFDSFGAEEPYRLWQEVDAAEFIFPVGWDPVAQFGFDMFFIVLGLILIPVSTMYLVRGGRKEMSTDKLFYGLILFLVGVGLFVGGIMP